MAATKLIAMHINKGKTLAQCLKARTDYAMDPDKTENGELVTSYECDPMTAAEEFLLSKRQYEQNVRRPYKNDVIAYQIRQSFKPGEVTPEEANEIGRELAMRFTKGKHAFIVATHTDCAHIHNHIIFNSTSLDCARKFKNFYLSSLALAHLSDLICLEHQLSVIQPKPYSERKKRTDYPHKKTFREEICEAIDATLDRRPKAFDEYEAVHGKGCRPKVKELNAEYTEILQRKKQNYAEYCQLREDAKKWQTACVIVQKILEEEPGQDRAEERQTENQQNKTNR